MNFSTLRLRPYQEEAQQAIIEARKRGFRAQLVSLATGLGKSVVIATLPELLELRPTDVTLVVAHRDELIQQLVEKLTAQNPDAVVGVEKADDYASEDCNIVVATVQTLTGARLNRFLARFGRRIALFVIEARSPDPLLPVKELRRAYPLIGAFACVFASGAYAAAQRGVAFFLTFIQARDQLTVAAVLSFAVIGALVAAPIYARVVAARWGAPMALVGLILLGIGSFAGTTFGTDRPLFATVVVVVILALGAGLTITPGLLTMALGVQGHFVGRAIALLALLRTEASYLTGPIATIFAASRGHHYAAQICLRCPDYNMDLDSVQRIVIGGTTGLINRAFPKPVLDAYLSGIHEGFLALTVLTAVAIVFVVVIFWRSVVHLVAPRIGCFLSDGVALESPPLFSDPAK